MKRKLKMYPKSDDGKRLTNPDVRPLDQREKFTPASIRKGMPVPPIDPNYIKAKQKMREILEPNLFSDL